MAKERGSCGRRADEHLVEHPAECFEQRGKLFESKSEYSLDIERFIYLYRTIQAHRGVIATYQDIPATDTAHFTARRRIGENYNQIIVKFAVPLKCSFSNNYIRQILHWLLGAWVIELWRSVNGVHAQSGTAALERPQTSRLQFHFTASYGCKNGNSIDFQVTCM